MDSKGSASGVGERTEGMEWESFSVPLDVAWAIEFPIGGEDGVAPDVEEGVLGEVCGAAAVVVLIDEVGLGMTSC